MTPPGGATLFVGKMLAYCVQDATVVDVEKRRSPSKHYVSTASTDPGGGGGTGQYPRFMLPGAALGSGVCSRGCDL